MPQINLKINDELNAKIESEAGGKRERAGWIRDLIRDELGPDIDSEPDTGHRPDTELDAKVYDALLEHGNDKVLKGYVRLDDITPQIAQTTQIGKDNLYQAFKRMERNNHVRLDHGLYAGDAIRIRARPPQADPEQWTRAKNRDNEIDPEQFRTPIAEKSTAKRRLLREIEASDELDTDASATPEVPADD